MARQTVGSATAEIGIERLIGKQTENRFFFRGTPLRVPESSKSGMEMPKVPAVSRYFVAYLASFVAVAPFFRAKVAPFFRAKDKPQTGTVKLFDKALCK